MPEKFEQKEVVNEKEKRWKEVEVEVEQIGDRLGKGIDDGIKPAVKGLMANGFKTTMSCEGHLDHGFPWPNIDIASPLEEAIENNPRYSELEEKVEKSLATFEEGGEYRKMRELILESRSKEVNKLKEALADFYTEDGGQPESIVVDEFGDIEPKEISELRDRIKGEILDIYKTWPEEEKKKNLEIYQKEFQRFAEFLKERFFSGK